MADNAQEPTMEEILASIRRIISEDEPVAEEPAAATSPAAAAPAPAEPPAAPPVAAAPPAAAAPSPPPPPKPVAAAPPPMVDDDEPLMLEDEVLELTDRVDETPPAAAVHDLDFAPVAAPAHAPPPSAAPPPPMTPLKRDEPLVSHPAATSAASAFDALERTVMMPPVGRSLEEVIREMLRPMLKDWLDQNLPSIVETQVAAEVERIARQRR